MIPLILTAIGAYLIGDSCERKQVFAKGGTIGNHYEGESAKEVWGMWSLEQREHFLRDHFAEELNNYGTISSRNGGVEQLKETIYLDWDALPRIAQMQVESHVLHGQYAKGGIVVTKIADIPNFKKSLDAGKITYRGLGMGKVYKDFYKLAGTGGTRIKVDGKEYFITDEEFDTFSRGADGKIRIRFDAPKRRFAEGGIKIETSQYFKGCHWKEQAMEN